MDTNDEPALTPRACRATALIAASLTAIVVVSLLYLHPSIGAPSQQPVVEPRPTPMLAGPEVTEKCTAH